MMASTLLPWMRVPSISAKYQTALIISGRVTFIAACHYMLVMFPMTDGLLQPVYNVLSFTMMATTLLPRMRVPSISAKYLAALIMSGMVAFIAAYHYKQILFPMAGGPLQPVYNDLSVNMMATTLFPWMRVPSTTTSCGSSSASTFGRLRLLRPERLRLLLSADRNVFGYYVRSVFGYYVRNVFGYYVRNIFGYYCLRTGTSSTTTFGTSSATTCGTSWLLRAERLRLLLSADRNVFGYYVRNALEPPNLRRRLT
jgi:hypothetical protein